MQENKTKNLLSKPKTLFKFRVRNKKHITLEFNPFLKQYLEHCTNLQREVEKKLEKSKSKIIN